jgi:selenium metabolism protein YedF
LRIIDCRGLACPEPVIRTRAALSEAGTSAIQVLVDNEAARGNVTRYARNNGRQVSEAARAGGVYELTLTAAVSASADAAGAVVAATTTEPSAAPGDGETDGSVVMITGDVLGRGDDALGAKLMGAFLYALAEADKVPAGIIFVNGGVRLTTGATAVRPHLEKLQARGSRIYSCGTCLDFYGLKDQLVIGDVTNMYSIVEACQRATRVINL